jgi:hypothetical protein
MEMNDEVKTNAERAQIEADERRQATRNAIARHQVAEFKKYILANPGCDTYAAMRRAYKNAVVLDYEAYGDNA